MIDFPEKLSKILAALDEDALVALASRGLVRRATKDLTRESPRLLTIGEEATVDVAGHNVHLPAAGPVQARCDCPAPGMCRHIVAATLFLRSLVIQSTEISSRTPGTPAADPWHEVLAMELDTLRTWASTDGFRRGVKYTQEELPEVEREPGLRVVFPDGIECRFISGAGLEGVICTAAPSEKPARVVAAVLAIQQAAGQNAKLLEARNVSDTWGPAQREQAAAVDALVLDAVHTGILHLSPAFGDRCRSLAAAVDQADLPRITRMLQALAREVELLLARHAQANEARVLHLLATLHALCTAILNAPGPPPTALVGTRRGRFSPFRRLRLAGLTAHRWRTRSGFDGVSVLFFDPAAQHFLSWTDVRREKHREQNDGEWIYRGAMPWPGGRIVRLAARSWLDLTDGNVSPTGRLSGTESCRAMLGEEVDPTTLDFGPTGFGDWRDLATHARDILPVGLAEQNPLRGIVALFPAAWGVKHFDEVHQVLRQAIFDLEGRAVQLVVPFTSTSQKTIQALEGADPKKHKLSGLLGRIAFDPDLTGEQGFAVRPLTLFGKDPEGRATLWHLDFESPQTSHSEKKRQRPWWWGLLDDTPRDQGEAVGLGSEEELAESLAGFDPFRGLSPHGERLLAAAERTIQTAADRGGSFVLPQAVDEARALADLGFTRLAAALAALGGPTPSAACLEAAYECRLHRQIAAREAIGF